MRLEVFTSSCTTGPSIDTPHSSVTLFSALSREAARVSPNQIIFEDEGVDGFWLGPYMAKRSLLQLLRMWRRAQKHMLDELKSTIRAEYALEDARRAVKDYLGHMTGGKVLLKPS